MQYTASAVRVAQHALQQPFGSIIFCTCLHCCLERRLACKEILLWTLSNFMVIMENCMVEQKLRCSNNQYLCCILSVSLPYYFTEHFKNFETSLQMFEVWDVFSKFSEWTCRVQSHFSCYFLQPFVWYANQILNCHRGTTWCCILFWNVITIKHQKLASCDIIVHSESKNTPNSCTCLRQIFTDGQNSFTGRLGGKFAVKILYRQCLKAIKINVFNYTTIV